MSLAAYAAAWVAFGKSSWWSWSFSEKTTHRLIWGSVINWTNLLGTHNSPHISPNYSNRILPKTDRYVRRFRSCVQNFRELTRLAEERSDSELRSIRSVSVQWWEWIWISPQSWADRPISWRSASDWNVNRQLISFFGPRISFIN